MSGVGRLSAWRVWHVRLVRLRFGHDALVLQAWCWVCCPRFEVLKELCLGVVSPLVQTLDLDILSVRNFGTAFTWTHSR
jgi:hypothetical protein